MLIRIIICLILLIIGHRLVAQHQPQEDLVSERADRKVYHYVGLQANQLIRQLLSFGGNSTAVTNPYLLTYSVNSKQTGVGFSTGLGYSSIQTKSTDNFTSVVSKVNDLAWRFGIEKKSYLSKRWLVSFGGDFLVEANKAETISNNGSNPNPTVTTKTSRVGFGPRASLNYQFHDKLLIGTEASYYFKWINQDQKVTGMSAPVEPSTSLRSFSFTLPAVVFLIVKL